MLGWAHKYEAMMQDFSVGDYIFGADDDWNRLDGMILGLLEKDAHEEVVARLRRRKQQMRPANDDMWETAFTLLQNVA